MIPLALCLQEILKTYYNIREHQPNLMSNIPFQVIDWSTISTTQREGETGTVNSRSLQLDDLRVRMIEYSAGYLADHWCQKGHIVHCLEGEFISEMENGEQFSLSKGMTYIVSDDVSSHRSKTKSGVKIGRASCRERVED